MTDFTTSRTSGGFRLADRVAREIVVVHVPLGGLLGDAVDGLRLTGRCQRADGHDLCLSSLEESASVRSREQAAFAPNRSNLVELSVVRTDALVEDHRADGFLRNIIEYGVDILGTLRINFRKMLLGLIFNCVHVLKSFQLIRRLNRFSHLRRRVSAHCLVDLSQRLIEFYILLRLADFLDDFFDEFHEFLDFLMREQNRVEHFHFRYFTRACLYHHNRFLGAGYSHVDIGFFPLLETRVDDHSAVHSADLHRAGRTVPRNVRNR